MRRGRVIRIRWFPPSWFLIACGKKVVYLDPAWIQTNFAGYPKRVVFSRYPDPMDGLPEPDLPKADLILVTHHHKDHQKRVTVDRLSTGKTVVAGTRKCTVDLGENVRIVKPGDEFQVGDIRVKVFDSYNTPRGSSTRKVHHKGECNSYLMELENRTIYHAGDTDFIPEMKSLGRVDVAMLPVGGRFTMDTNEAMEAAIAINPRYVIPMHYRGDAAEIFKERLARKSEVEAVVLSTGETFRLN